MALNKPVIIRIGQTAQHVNLNQVAYYTVIKDEAHVVKKATGDTADVTLVADTITFYFIGGGSVQIIKGQHMTDTEFEETANLLEGLVYYEGERVPKEATRRT